MAGITVSQNLASSSNVVLGSATAPQFVTQAIYRTADAITTPAADIEQSSFLSVTSAGAWTETQVDTALSEGLLTLTSLTPATATISGNVIAKAGSGGPWQVRVTRGSSIGSTITGTTASGAQTVLGFDGFVANSTADKLADAVLDRMTSGKTEGFYQGYDATAPSFTLSSSCWAAGIDLSGVPVATNLFVARSAANRGCLVTSRHLMGAYHWQFDHPYQAPYGGYAIGQHVWFRSSDGTLVERTIVGTAHQDDCVVATLDSAVPGTVAHYKVAGDWFIRSQATVAGYSSTVSHYLGGVVFYPDQQFRCRIMLGGATAMNTRTYAPSFSLNGHTYSNRALTLGFSSTELLANRTPSILTGKTSYLNYGVLGDSGSPMFVLKGSEPVVLGTMWYSSACYNAVGTDGSGHTFLNDVIALADANAGVSTGLTVTLATSP